MEKIREKLVLEPDFGGDTLEEIADIPEKVAGDMEIEGDIRLLPDEPAGERAVETEEIAQIASDFRDPVEITDEFEPVPEEPLLSGSTDEFDISSIAAEIDMLTSIEPAARPPAPVKKPPVTGKGIRREIPGEIVIREEDEIDLDYYSLEDLSGEGDIPVQDRDMPVFDESPDMKLVGREEALKEIPLPVEFEEERIPAKKHGAGELPVPAADAEKEYPEDLEAELDAPIRDEEAVPGPEAAEEKENILTIEIPEDIKERLSDDFDIQELGSIDLREAEKVASEDVLFLTEDDLIEELEEFDLMPLDSGKGADAGKRAGRDVPEGKKQTPEEKKASAAVKAPDTGPPGKKETEIPKVPMPGMAKKTAGAAPSVDEGISADEVPAVIPGGEGHPRRAEAGGGIQRKAVPAAPEENELEKRGPSGPLKDEEMFSEIILEEDGGEFLSEKPAVIESPRVPVQPSIEERKRDTIILREEAPTDQHKAGVTEHVPDKTYAAAMKESISPEFKRVETMHEDASFIDDELVEKKEKSDESIFQVSELEKITSEIVEVIEGKAKVLLEADAADDLDKIAGIMRGTTPAFEDLLIDMESEYSFTDDEIDYIDHTFSIEDYGKYMDAIDSFSGSESGGRVSSAVELLGLDHDEMGLIENSVFFREYSGIDLEAVRSSPPVGFDQPPSDFNLLKKCTYILSRSDSLLEREKRDIEEDIDSENALLYEENVDEIKNKLNELRRKKGIDTGEGAADISDKVIIIENERDVKRFIDTLPKEKQESLTKLLRYLDGLFEKLPEDVIKKFASSEYFDLYSKVLQDLGV